MNTQGRVVSARASFRSRVEATIRRRSLLKGGERVLVAVSGGPDSLALLHVLREIAPSWGLDLHVAHFDHRLREASEADAIFVSRVARRLDLPFVLGSADAGRPAGLSPEEAARHRRLAFLEEAAVAAGADRIATGHTLDDQAETVLMRLLVGAGTRGLSGIPPARDRYVRPLIDVRRSEVEAYCRALHLRPRRDPTNADPAFLRNALRHDVLPFLAGRVNNRLIEALARFADVFRDDDELLDRLAREAVEVEQVPGAVRVDLEALRGLPTALRRRVLRLALPHGPVGLVHVEAIADLVERGRSGDAVDLPAGLNARLEYGSLLIGRAPSSAPLRPVTLVVPGRTDLPGWGVAVTAWERRETPSTWPDGKGTCVMDAARAGGPLVARPPKAGDRIVPFGMRGSRLVSDLLGEAKIPRSERTRVPVVASGGRVVWVVGHRVSEEVKVTGRTERFLWMTVEGGAPWGS